jgi:hypothetical protein
MKIKHLLKRGIQIAISCNLSPTAIFMYVSKKQILFVLDRVIPDENKE